MPAKPVCAVWQSVRPDLRYITEPQRPTLTSNTADVNLKTGFIAIPSMKLAPLGFVTPRTALSVTKIVQIRRIATATASKTNALKGRRTIPIPAIVAPTASVAIIRMMFIRNVTCRDSGAQTDVITYCPINAMPATA